MKYLSGQSWQGRVIIQPLALMWELGFSKLLDLIRPTTVGLQRFWTTIETEEVSWQWNVEVPALSWALATTSGEEALPLRQAFRLLSISQKTHCALLTVANSIGFHTADGSISDNPRELRRFQRLLYRPDRSFESLREDHVDIMVEALSSRWVATNWASADSNISPLLMLLHLTTRAERLSEARFFRLLIDARANQEIRTTDPLYFLNQRMPTLLLCRQVYRTSRIGMTPEDATQLVKFAQRDLYLSQWLPASNIALNRGATRSAEWLLASTASALTALTVHPHVLSADRKELRELLLEFSKFITKHKSTLAVIVKHSERKEQEELLFVTHLAMTMICTALESLADAKILPLAVDCPSITLVDRLHAIFSGTKRMPYQTGRHSLVHFRELIAGSGEAALQTRVSESQQDLTDDGAHTNGNGH
ncbi:hypothetical protein EIP86_009632 [Pleurotus ostreatoroseus]|nr:hypothetical protein EIP86_009632 [Pleurotus ostreatoroseus]